MREATTRLVRREDYAAPAYFIRAVELSFDLDPAKTIVASRLTIERNPALPRQPLRLHGESLTLLRVQSEQLAQRVNLHLALGGSFETRLALKTTTELNSKQTPSTP